MTTAAQLLTECAARGIALQARGGVLRFHPRESVTPALLEALRTCKPKLLEILQPQDVTFPRKHTEPADGWKLPEWPPIVDPRIIADPIPTCSDCGQPRVIAGQPGRPEGLCWRCWVTNEAERVLPGAG